jgi:hypothetical protein
MAAIVRPRFYPVLALLLALVVFAGFARTFYLRYWFDVPPLTVLLFLHGLTYSAWMVLFVVQTRLVAANQVRTHMRLGFMGVGLAALTVAVGLATVVMSASAPRPRAMGMVSYQFVLVPFFNLVAFSGLVTAAVLLRKRPQFHKRLMTLAMITVLPPATARLINLFGVGGDFLVIQTSITAAFVVVALAYDWLKNRTLHPVYLVGGTLLVLSWPFRAWFARTETWAVVGKWMASLSGP